MGIAAYTSPKDLQLGYTLVQADTAAVFCVSFFEPSTYIYILYISLCIVDFIYSGTSTYEHP